MGRYELMDVTTGNFAGIYATQEEALRDVVAHIARFGEDAAADLALGYNDYPRSDGRVVAEGAELVALARKTNGRASANGADATRSRSKANRR
jgi:hypothetical protein